MPSCGCVRRSPAWNATTPALLVWPRICQPCASI
jgi:hypothetical protein